MPSWPSPHAAARTSKPLTRQYGQVSRVAERYYDAFRAGQLEDACRYVADRLLPTRPIAGTNTRQGEQPRFRPSTQPRAGCAAVRFRHRGWSEPIPRAAWQIEDVLVDREAIRARVDTTAEGSYWMRRLDDKWRIVAFGSLTDKGVRELGGEWKRNLLNP